MGSRGERASVRRDDVIRVERGPEPPELAPIRQGRLKALGAWLTKPGSTPSAKEIGEDYQRVKGALFKAQHHKCAYCELIINLAYSDLEHFRPKAEADRSPGCTERYGYWWLAWTWENVLLSCNMCNRPQREGRGKGTFFPLAAGSFPLTVGQNPPGKEVPLLLDPTESGVLDHIVYRCEQRGTRRVWIPRPRNGSARGEATIRICALDLPEKIDIYTAHVEEEVEPQVRRWDELHAYTSDEARRKLWSEIEGELYASHRPFIGLSYDALRLRIPESELKDCGAVRRCPST